MAKPEVERPGGGGENGEGGGPGSDGENGAVMAEFTQKEGPPVSFPSSGDGKREASY